MAEQLLWTPLQLGPVTVRNRIVFSAHLTNYAQDGKPTEQHAAYYQERAAGGVGLIITEEHSTHPTDWPYEKLIHGFHRDVIPGYRRITDAVHRHRTPIFAQINHNGGQASSLYSRLPVWAPSPVADPLFREVPKAVDRHEIAEIVAGYARVAENCAEGGFDGIELQCSHSSIVRGFLSPATNRRTDDYGGPLANRARILLEIVAAVRAAIGTELALGVRICGDELIEGGTTIDDAVEVARMVEGSGHVDYINTSIGVATASLFMIEASMHIPPGYAMFIPSALRQAVDLPVVGVGRFKDPLQAERALAEGQCDLVGVVRGQIADAEFVAKARAGFTDDTRLCLSCNQECVGRMGLNRWLGCIENPRTGRESEGVGEARPVAVGRRVLVIGAGPAGLQAAIAAARNGHHVTVLEREPHAGGQVRLAATVPNRAELGDLVRNQVHECGRLGVTIEYGVDATASDVERRRPDSVIVAAGGRLDRRRPRRPHRGRSACRRRRRPRRAGLPPRHVGGRGARGSGLPGRGDHPGHGRRPGPGHHAGPGDLVDPRRGQGDRPVHRAGPDGRRGRRRRRSRRQPAAPPHRVHAHPHPRLAGAGGAGRPGRRAVPRAAGVGRAARPWGRCRADRRRRGPPPRPRRGHRRRARRCRGPLRGTRGGHRLLIGAVHGRCGSGPPRVAHRMGPDVV